MWEHNGQHLDSIPEGYTSFVYQITNLIDGRKYIGKKLFVFTRTKTLKGKRKKIKEESDWKDYWSSSEELKADVAKLGKENFKREILHLCKNKGTASYLEAKLQLFNEVLEKPNEWYNAIVSCRVHRNHIKL
jgi:hypothetical protein